MNNYSFEKNTTPAWMQIREERGFMYAVWFEYSTKLNAFKTLVVDGGQLWVGTLRKTLQ